MNYDFNTRDTDMLLSSLSVDLLMENIDEQISNKTITVNYLDTIDDKIKVALDSTDDGEELTEIKSIRDDIAVKVIEMIERKCGIDIDTDSIITTEDETLMDIAMALYEFFVIYYVDNIKEFVFFYINANKKRLAKELHLEDKKKTKLESEDFSYILNLIKTMDISGKEFLEYSSEEDDYSSYIINKLLNQYAMDDNFVDYFFDYIDTNLDSLVFFLQSRFNKSK